MSGSVRLETTRLVIRDFNEADEADFFALVSNVQVTAPLSFGPKNRSEAATMLRGILARQAATPRDEYYLGITRREDEGRVIGFARLGLGSHQAASIGCAVHVDWWRQGIALEAATAMLDFGFGALGLHRISAEVGPENEASLALVRKLGFTREGVIRDHVHKGGVWRDSVSFGVLAHEWGNTPDAPAAPASTAARPRSTLLRPHLRTGSMEGANRPRKARKP